MRYTAGVSDESDAGLLQRWVSGDQRAGAQLYRRHAGSLTRFFRNKAAERDVPDLMQATFMRCFEHHARHRPDASFRAFLLGFARNILLHHYRTHHRKGAQLDFGVSSIVELGVSPTGIIAEQQAEQRLIAALRSLPLEQQILLELFYWEGMQGDELAEFYAVPVGTIRTRLRRARQLLASAYETASGAIVSVTDLEGWARGIRDSLRGC
jgi:RNA polymerase sigma-70 factor (ECF subfamily)